MNIIDSVLTCDEDRKFYSERGFRIDKAVLYEKTKELDIFSTSDMEILDRKSTRLNSSHVK